VLATTGIQTPEFELDITDNLFSALDKANVGDT
jgi:hypothetical protein